MGFGVSAKAFPSSDPDGFYSSTTRFYHLTQASAGILALLHRKSALGNMAFAIAFDPRHRNAIGGSGGHSGGAGGFRRHDRTPAAEGRPCGC